LVFRYGQFGEGFARGRPAPEALRLAELCTRRGEEVTVVRLRRVGEGSYGEPVYSEERHALRAMVERSAGEEVNPAGDLKTGGIRLYAAPWAAVGEEGHEVEVDGLRFHVSSLVRTRAYLRVEGERRLA
jgi:hypothetical protein